MVVSVLCISVLLMFAAGVNWPYHSLIISALYLTLLLRLVSPPSFTKYVLFGEVWILQPSEYPLSFLGSCVSFQVKLSSGDLLLHW